MVAKPLSEAEKLAPFPGLIFVDGAAGRRASIVGSLDVWEVMKAYHEFGDDRDVLERAFDWLTPAQFDLAFRYYAAFPGEIDAFIAMDQALVPEWLRST